MDDQKIIVEIDQKGFITVKAKGMTGAACIDGVTRLLKDIAVITDIDKTDEYYGTTGVQEKKKSKVTARRE